jgi:dipeptidyl aminopeptidase/acylaminoacyl peptidase
VWKLILLAGLVALVHASPARAGCGFYEHFADSGPVWSPDGRWIAFGRDLIGCSEPHAFGVVAVDGASEHVFDPQARTDPLWTPDGQLYVETYPYVLRVRPPSTRVGRMPAMPLDVSRDGTRVAWIAYARDAQRLYVAAPDVGGARELRALGPDGARALAFSPDGATIALAEYRGRLSLVDVATGGRRTLLNDATGVSWLDERRLLVERDSRTIAVVAVAAGKATTVAAGSTGGHVPVSADGQWIAYSAREIRLVHVDGTGDHAVVAGGDPAFSPDGARLAYVTNSRDCPETRVGIFVLELATNVGRRLTNDCHVRGTDGADTLAGSDDDDVVDALGGDDRVTAGGGADVVRGGDGNDRVDGGPQWDVLLGGGGDDTLLETGGRNRLVGGPGNDSVRGGIGRDTIELRDGSRDRASCGAGRDVVYADRSDLVARDCERVVRR